MILTNTGFWTIVLILLTIAGVLVTFEILEAKETLSDERLAAVLEPVVYDDLCAIEYCNRYASTPLPGPDHAVLVCRVHSGLASEWTGPALYDQTGDVA